MHLIDTIRLPNGLDMEVWDATRSIAADTVRVDLIIRIAVEVKPEYFQEPEQYQTCRSTLGHEVIFEYKKERSFVPMALGWPVLNELLTEFKTNCLEYISKPNFPARFVMSRYMEAKKKTGVYQSH